jgi:MoaA/NifB/PqqE/SkfB family radical SAM enzyme
MGPGRLVGGLPGALAYKDNQMKLSTLSGLAVQHLRNSVAESVYLKTGYDSTRPITFHGLVNERCNIKCRYCEYWRMDEYQEEMSIDEWQQALLSVRDFVGNFSISFSGGEPYLKKGFLDLLTFCNEVGIHAGVTTNGSAMNEKNARRTVEARPFNVNISCDACSAEIQDYVRGYPGLFDTITKGIGYLQQYQRELGVDFPIIIKPVVHAANFRQLPALVEWANEVGATAVNFQPMDRWTQETYDELWIEEAEHGELEFVIDRLLHMKKNGAKIMNSEQVLKLIPAHFREESAPPEAMPCRVGMRDCFIRPNGDVEPCFFYDSIGNLRENSLRDIWYGEAGRENRCQTTNCEKLCLFTCLSQKGLKDKVQMGIKLITE